MRITKTKIRFLFELLALKSHRIANERIPYLKISADCWIVCSCHRGGRSYSNPSPPHINKKPSQGFVTGISGVWVQGTYSSARLCFVGVVAGVGHDPTTSGL